MKQMDHFKKRFVTDLVVSSLIVAALLIGVVFFLGQAGDYAQGIISDRALLAGRTKTVDQLANLRQQYAKASSYLNVLYNIIPSYDQLINLNQDIQSLAARNKIEYGFSFAGETPKTPGGIGSIVFNLSLGSTELDSLISFVKSLQDFRYLSSIDNISMRSNNEKLTMEIRGRVFYR